MVSCSHLRFLLLVLGMTLSMNPGIARAAEAGVSDNEIVVGQVLGLTGPLAALAPDIANSVKVLFDSVNEKGGVYGRKIRVVTRDDGYAVPNTVKVVRQLIEEDRVFALLNMTGTSNVAAALPLLEQEKPAVPLVAPFTGADLVRNPPIKHVFNIRASYADEAEKIVQHLTTIGKKRISVLWSNNGFGQDGLAGVQKAMEKRGLKIYSSVSIEQNASDTERAVAALHDTRPEAIIMITAGAPTVSFIKSYSSLRKGMQFYTLSVMGTQSTLRALGQDGVGVVVTSVVPFPWDYTHPLAKEYRAAMLMGGYRDLSFLGFEGYINAKVFVEGLKLAGKDLTRTKFIHAMESMKRSDFGGFEVSYSKDSRQGSRFVGLTIIGPGEKFTK